MMKVTSLKSLILCFALVGLMLMSNYTTTVSAINTDNWVFNPCKRDNPPRWCSGVNAGPIYMQPANPYRRPCSRFNRCRRDFPPQ
ncbi:hypothetical protein RND81_03G065000 [Saponaria officinalis]|uniref:Rapid ALkalinization Factor n=1 Tax=Saponaria officinalis TaxID=3572 RepID=A0AAW1LYJ3_SAPOF